MTFPEDPIDVYPMGQRVVMFVDFADVAEVADDPDVVTLQYLEGDGKLVAVWHAALDNPSVGRWEYGLTIPLDGDKAAEPWTYRYDGTSVDPAGVNSADEKRFEVAPSPFYPPTT